MAGVIKASNVGGTKTLYAVIEQGGNVVYGTTVIAPGVLTRADIAIAMTFTNDSLQESSCAIPAIPAGFYDAKVYSQAGGSPAASDVLYGIVQGGINWDGSSERAYIKLDATGKVSPADDSITEDSITVGGASKIGTWTSVTIAGDINGQINGWPAAITAWQESISMDAAEGVPNNRREWDVWLFSRFGLATTVKDNGDGTIVVMRSDGVTPQTTNPFTSVGGVDTVEAAE